MRMDKLVCGVVAFAFVFTPIALWAGGVRPVAFENRELASAPDLADGWSALDEVGPWASDHLPGRVQAVRANSWIDYYLLGTLPDSRGPSSTAGVGGVTAQGSASDAPATASVVRGRDGYLFFGQDFDNACKQSIEDFRAGLRTLRGLADDLQRSGRTVRFSVAPNKTSVASSELPRALPRGACAADGFAQQERTLARYSPPRFVPLLEALRRQQEESEQPYWKTDTHWSSVGSSTYAEALARSLSPALADQVRTEPTVERKTGDLLVLAGLTYAEEAPAVAVETGGRVQGTAGTPDYDPLAPVYEPIRWQTSPSSGLVKGRTLFVGDSFTYFALDSLRPLVARGTFMWAGRVDDATVIEEMLRSDTIVLSTVQRSVVGNTVALPRFRKAVDRALAAEAARGGRR